jgi:rfaE bifunctional protein nucleotidyltransferase chain/domain
VLRADPESRCRRRAVASQPVAAWLRSTVKSGQATDGCFVRGVKAAEWARHLACSLPRPLVFTNGVFDLLHAGHVACIEQARALGNSLVVGINTDASARRLGKGPLRPCHAAADRARVVAALAKPLALISALRPDILDKGGDYAADRLAETALMAEWGGRTVIVPRVPGLSTTQTIQRLSGLGRAR